MSHRSRPHRQPDAAMYLAALTLTMSSILCGATNIDRLPGMLPLLLLVTVCGVPASYWFRSRRFPREWVNRGAGAGALLVGVVFLGAGPALPGLTPDSMLQTGIDTLALSYLESFIAYVCAWRCFALMTDLDLVQTVGFGLSLFVLLGITEPDGWVLGHLAVFAVASLFVLMRYRQRRLRRRVEQVIGKPPGTVWRRDARTLSGLGVAVAALSLLLSMMLSHLQLPETLLMQQGAPLVQRLARLLSDLYTSASSYSGFAQAMDAGDAGASNSGAVIFEVRTRQPGLWRGGSYSHYDGRTWLGSSAMPRELDRYAGEWLALPGPYRYASFDQGLFNSHQITVRSHRFDALYLPPEAVALRLPAGRAGTVPGGGVVVHPPLRPGTEFTVLTPLAGAEQPLHIEPLTPRARRRYTQLPEVSAAVRATTARVTAGLTSDDEKILALVGYLAEHKVYTRRPEPVPGDQEVTDWFLRRMDAGWCRHFATALAVMGRVAGIPTRVVDGYITGEPDQDGEVYTVRARDRHAWVEAWLPGQGWQTYDVTALTTERLTGLPALLAQLRTVSREWREALAEASWWVPPALLALVLALVAALILGRFGGAAAVHRRLTSSPAWAHFRFTRPAWRLQRRLERELRRLGLRRLPWETVSHLAGRAATTCPALADALLLVAEAINDGKYSGRELSREQIRIARQALQTVARHRPPAGIPHQTAN